MYGLNHETAPVEVREKYVASAEESRRALVSFKPIAFEAVFLSTCNRVEFYLRAESMDLATDQVREWFRKKSPLTEKEARGVFYRRKGWEAFRHLFRVASSLDSMVVGEAQILGQVKSAYRDAVKAGTVGPYLNAVFQRAFAAAKRVRHQTDIARRPVSVSSVAVEMALRIFGRLDERTVLVLGAGEMSENTARQLVCSGVKRLFVANRTLDKARILARRLKGRALTLPKGLEILREVDIVISSIGGPGPFLSAQTVRKAMEHRREKPLALIDIGVPRNMEPEAGRIQSVHLFNIDDLSRTAQANREKRAAAVVEAEAILEKDLQDLLTWLQHRSHVPAIRELRQRVETIRFHEWEDYLRKNPGLDSKTILRMERLSKSASSRFLHASTLALKEKGGEIRLAGYAESVRALFRSDEKISAEKGR